MTASNLQNSTAYQTAVRSAVVAGVFSAVVCALLIADYAHRLIKNPLDSPEFTALKADLLKEPRNEAIKERIRSLDLELRERYFQERGFARVGGYLLFAGLAVSLIAAKTAATLRRRQPMPGPFAEPKDMETVGNRAARGAVVVLALGLIGGAIWLRASFSTVWSGSPQESGVNVSGAPSAEEIRRNWPRFRGPSGLGIAAYTNLPSAWDGRSGRGIRWKTPVPLPGNNSPVVWGNRVFLSGATPEHRQVYCFDADDGDLLWQRDAPSTPQSVARRPKVSEDTGYAAPTVTTNGRGVFAIFANGDLAAFDFDGRLAWSRSLGIPESAYGYASSLTMFGDLLLVQFDQGSSAKAGKSRLYALHSGTGETAWEVKRGVPNSWSSPIVIQGKDRPRVITSADPWVIAYDPTDGAELWRAKCLQQDVGPSPVCSHGVVYVASQFPALSAIRADGRGDVGKSHILWKGQDGLPDTASPLATDEFVFLLASYGTLTCYDARKGGVLWEKEFEDATFTSSPSLAGGRLYLFSVEGKAWIVEPSRAECKVVAENDLGEPCVTSPAMLDGRIYIRGKEHLFCIGAP